MEVDRVLRRGRRRPRLHGLGDREVLDGGEVCGAAPWQVVPLSVHIHLGDGTFEGPPPADDLGARHRLRRCASASATASNRARPAPGDPRLPHRRARPAARPEPPGRPASPATWSRWSPPASSCPVNIAFVPNPGPSPDRPALLRHRAVRHDQGRHPRRHGQRPTRTGLLNFNPTGTFPGSGEQGLTGIAVDPATGDLFAAMLYEDTAPPQRARTTRRSCASTAPTAA